MSRLFVDGVLDALNRFEKAVRADQAKYLDYFEGGLDPKNKPAIEQELKEAREEMEDLLSQIN